MPIYVAEDSSDMWANPHLFKTDENGKATCIAGCPPDEFSATGQLWGTQSMTGKQWTKMATNGGLNACVKASRSYDIVRIDHFRGFESYWKSQLVLKLPHLVKWVKGPGYKLFAAVKEELGDLNIIAEDLGFMTDEVIELRERTGFQE